MNTYDVLVIGAGPGGYVAAIRCAQLGRKVACVDSFVSASGKPALGGTCLNVGCIPSKALLDSSHHFEHISKHVGEHGIMVGDVTLDVATMMQRKSKVVQTLTLGVASLLKKNKVDVYYGHARFINEHEIAVDPLAGGDAQPINAGNIIIATGSVPVQIPPAKVDDKQIVDSTGALAFDSVPRRMGVIGAGVIGLELGSWCRSHRPGSTGYIPRRGRSEYRRRCLQDPDQAGAGHPAWRQGHWHRGNHRRRQGDIRVKGQA